MFVYSFSRKLALSVSGSWFLGLPKTRHGGEKEEEEDEEEDEIKL